MEFRRFLHAIMLLPTNADKACGLNRAQHQLQHGAPGILRGWAQALEPALRELGL
jgi:hypothetical protein